MVANTKQCELHHSRFCQLKDAKTIFLLSCESMLMHNLCVSPCIKHGAAEGGYVAVPNVLLLKITLIKKKKKKKHDGKCKLLVSHEIPVLVKKNYIGKAEQDRLCRCGLSRLAYLSVHIRF